jgi:hypothetical protein
MLHNKHIKQVVLHPMLGIAHGPFTHSNSWHDQTLPELAPPIVYVSVGCGPLSEDVGVGMVDNLKATSVDMLIKVRQQL